MYYPEFDITIPDAVMVVGRHVYACFDPQYTQSIARYAQPWYTMDDGVAVEDAFDAMELDYGRNMVSVPIDWIDYTILPPLEHKG